jgi:stress response protein YsnF
MQGQKKVTTTINNDDLQFMKEHNLTVAGVIREAISQKRAWTSDNLQGNFQEAHRKMLVFKEKCEKLVDFIQKKSLIDEFYNSPPVLSEGTS